MTSRVSLAMNQTAIKANNAGHISLSVAELTLSWKPSNGNRHFPSRKGKESVITMEPITSRSSHIKGSLSIPTVLILSNFLLHPRVANQLIGVSIVCEVRRTKIFITCSARRLSFDVYLFVIPEKPICEAPLLLSANLGTRNRQLIGLVVLVLG